METKICNKCGKEKFVGDFPKTGRVCKVCVSLYGKKYRQKNKEKIKEYLVKNKENTRKTQKAYSVSEKGKASARRYQNNNREKLAKRQKERAKKEPEKIKERWKNYHANNREELNKRRKEKYRTDPTIKEKQDIWDANNRERINEQALAWYHKNKEKARRLQNEQQRKASQSLTDSFVSRHIQNQIGRQGVKITTAEIPQELIDYKRLQLLLKRKLKNY